ncbi:MAG: hypothetical protein WBX25_07795 [Rhodomicrobium sp.]
MSGQFDASFAYSGPISDEVRAAQAQEVEHLTAMPGKLANAKLHAGNELQRWVLACNRLFWGEMPAELRKPSQDEINALLVQLSPENRERLLKESKLAAEQRHLVALLEAAAGEAHARQQAQEAEAARAETELAEWEAFEEYDAAGKQARFEAWRAARPRSK